MTQKTVRAWEAGVPPAPSGRTGRFEKVLFIPDIHFGDQHDPSLALALRVQRYFAPQRIIQLGDALDFYGLSRFDKDPDVAAFRVQEELDLQYAFYKRVKEVSPRALCQQIEGNHEARGHGLVLKNPALSRLNALQLPKLMRLDELKWEPIVHQRIELANGALLATHGRYAPALAGSGPRKELFRAWRSIITGHTHKLSTFPHSTETTEFVAVESGHLQNNPSRWAKGYEDWQRGLVLGWVEVDGNSFDLYPVRFRSSNRCMVFGKELSA